MTGLKDQFRGRLGIHELFLIWSRTEHQVLLYLHIVYSLQHRPESEVAIGYVTVTDAPIHTRPFSWNTKSNGQNTQLRKQNGLRS